MWQCVSGPCEDRHPGDHTPSGSPGLIFLLGSFCPLLLTLPTSLLKETLT